MCALFKKQNTSGSIGKDAPKSIINAAEEQVLKQREKKINLENKEDTREFKRKALKYLLIGVSVVSAMFLMRYLASSRENEEKDSTAKCLELEKIENKIIIGIKNKEDEAVLLDLVTQLNHEDSRNYIDGKKQGIIHGYLGPDDKFHGTYSAYWTGLRESYKEIIISGISIEQYMENIKNEELKQEKENKDYQEKQSKKEKVVKNKKEVKKKKVEETNASEDDNSGNIELLDDEYTEKRLEDNK
jgi:hypothetical protein